jgi:hypothetical protein
MHPNQKSDSFRFLSFPRNGSLSNFTQLQRKINRVLSILRHKSRGTIKYVGARGSVVGCYKQEGRGFESR